MRGVIADLLEADEEGEDDAWAPVDAVDRLDPMRQILHRLLVERRLLAAQRAERLDLRLVRQIGDDRSVGLQAAQDVGAGEIAQRPIGIMWVRSASRLTKVENWLAWTP